MTSDIVQQEAELVLDAKSILGEGALWQPKEKVLYWVDIEGKSFNVFEPESGVNKQYDVGARIGTVVPATKGGVLLALQNGIYHLDLQSENLTLLKNPLQNARVRFNDGKCDPAGRFWIGTMALDKQEGAAVLFRLDTDGSVHQVLDNLTIANGIAWTADKKTMYFTDTPTQKIVAFTYDPESGAIQNKRTVVEIPKKEGSPDGMTLDADGNIWVALHGGGCVACYDPATGKVLQKVNVPCPQVTSCAFGGKNLETLFITTATEGLNEIDLKKYPHSGGIFATNLGVSGVAANFYDGEVYM